MWNGQQMQNLAPRSAWHQLKDDRLWKQGEAAHIGCSTDGGELLGEEKTWSKQYSLRMNISRTWWRLSRSEEKRFPHKGLVVQMGWKGQAAETASARQWARTEHKRRGWSEPHELAYLNQAVIFPFKRHVSARSWVIHQWWGVEVCSKIVWSQKSTSGLQIYTLDEAQCSALVLPVFFPIFFSLGEESSPQLSNPAFFQYTTQVTIFWQPIWHIF